MELHDHPISLIRWWLGGVLWTSGLATLAYYWNWQWAAIIWGIGMVPLLIKVWLWRRDKIALTIERIFIVEGIISFRLSETPLKEITGSELIEPWHARLLAWLGWAECEYGRLEMESGGQDEKLRKIVFIPAVNEVKKIILAYTLGDGIPVTDPL